MLRANNKTKSCETWSSPLADISFLVSTLSFSNFGWKGFLVGQWGNWQLSNNKTIINSHLMIE